MFQPLSVIPGFDLWPGLLDLPAQRALVDAVMPGATEEQRKAILSALRTRAVKDATTTNPGMERSMPSPSAAPSTPVNTTNTAVRSGTPPMSPDTVIANGVLMERGSKLKRSSPPTPSKLASAQADSRAGGSNSITSRPLRWAAASTPDRRSRRSFPTLAS